MLYRMPLCIVLLLLLLKAFLCQRVQSQSCLNMEKIEGRREIPKLDYHPVVILPINDTVVLDLTKPPIIPGPLWSIGKYDEDRVIYDQPLFEGKRTIHVGIDLGGPPYSAVHAFWDGRIIEAGINRAAGDYGPTLISEHKFFGNDTIILYALFGHLSTASLSLSPIGREFKRGDVIAWLGKEDENGGWPPHVHFQLSWERPQTHDMPGAVSKQDREAALNVYPDPQLILGKLY